MPHVLEGGLELVDALLEVGTRAVGVEQAGGEFLDGGLDFLLQDLHERPAMVLRSDSGMVQMHEKIVVDARIHPFG